MMFDSMLLSWTPCCQKHSMRSLTIGSGSGVVGTRKDLRKFKHELK